MSRLPIEKLVEKYQKTYEKNISEGIVDDVVKKFGNWIKQKASALFVKIKSVFSKNIAGKNYLMYSTGGDNVAPGVEFGILGKGAQNGKPLTKLFAAYQKKPSQMTIAFKKPTDSNQTNENTFLFRLHQELNEAGRPKSVAPATSTAKNDLSDKEVDDLEKEFTGFISPRTEIEKNTEAEKQKAKETRANIRRNLPSIIGKGAQDIVDPLPELFTPDNMNPGLSSEGIIELLGECLERVELRDRAKGGDIPSVLIQGFPGWGKTSMVKQIAQQVKMNLKILEIKSTVIDYLTGLPVIEEKFEKLKKEDPNGKDFNITKEEMVVHMKAVQGILPPSESDDPWILFLDEFNVDSNKMRAVMNLVLSGQIGTSYFLPQRTMVILAGNLGKQVDGQPVQDMDSAIFDRVDAHVFLKMSSDAAEYLAGLSDKYSTDPKEFLKDIKNYKASHEYLFAEKRTPEQVAGMETRKGEQTKLENTFPKVPVALSAFMQMINKEYGFKPDKNGVIEWDPVKIKEQLKIRSLTAYRHFEGGENDKEGTTLSPRRLQKIGEIVNHRAAQDWIKAVSTEKETGKPSPLPLENKKQSTDYHWYIKQFGKNREQLANLNIINPAAYYLHINQWDGRYLPDIFKTSFGGDPDRVADKIRNFHIEFKNTFKELDVKTIISDFNRKYNDGVITDSDVNSISQKFSVEVVKSLFEIGSDKNLEKLLSDSGVKKEDFTKYGDDPKAWVALNIVKFYQTAKFAVEIAKAIIGNCLDSIVSGDSSKYTTEEKFVLKVMLAIAEFDDDFKKAWDTCYEIFKTKSGDNPSAESKAHEFVQKKELVGDKFTIPSIEGKEISKELGAKILYVLNMIKLYPNINKSLRMSSEWIPNKENTSNIEPVPENKIIESGLKNLFERML